MPKDQQAQIANTFKGLPDQAIVDILARGVPGIVDALARASGYSASQVHGFLNNTYSAFGYPGYPGGVEALGRDLAAAAKSYEAAGRAAPNLPSAGIGSDYAAYPGGYDSAPASAPAASGLPFSPGEQDPGLSGFDNTTFAPSTYSGPADLSGDPGGLQDAMPGAPTDIAPALSAPFESVPMVQGPMDLPGISIAGLGMPEASDAMGGELPMLIAEVAQSVGMQPQQLAEIMITAQELARSLGIPVEMALQVIMQSAAQPQGGRYA
jgi:hypothetical protein